MANKHADVLAASSLVLSSVTASWFAMMPDFNRVRVATTNNVGFTDELRHAEITVIGVSLSLAAIVSFYLHDYVPLTLCSAVLALLLFTYEREFHSNPTQYQRIES